MTKESKFNINFLEFSFLVETCIPPVPIARSMFFKKVSDYHYHLMTDEQRKELLELVTTNSKFNINNQDCSHFFDRYTPNNQYLIGVKGEDDFIYAYLHNNRFHTKKDTLVLNEMIESVTKLTIT